MTLPRARFHVMRDAPGVLVLRDVGPWDVHPTVTNDIEAVIAHLFETAQLMPTQQLFYIDSGGSLTEVYVKDGKFAGFGPNASELAYGKAGSQDAIDIYDIIWGKKEKP